jgi:hypothetical protein
MKLPGADSLVVEQQKLCGYLLNPSHRHGASKARFFAEFGFSSDGWQDLARALREHGQAHSVSRKKETPFGPRYEVEGELAGLDGRRPQVCTVWQLDEGQIAPRLITAYPLKRNV